jgi:hypothetical protein
VTVRPARLWFGVLTAAVAWGSMGMIETLIVWRTCISQNQFGGGNADQMPRAICFGIALLLLATGILAGVTSYRNWRKLSCQSKLIDSLATERREFMALLGVFVSVTLGMGMIWLSLPPIIIHICERAK